MRITRFAYPFANPIAQAFARRNTGNFENQIEQLLGSVFGNTANSNASGFIPVDLYEDKENTYIRAELPGVARSDISIELVDGSLAITATRKNGAGEDAQVITLKRAVQVPENTQPDKISAKSEDGILTVTLPKLEQPAPRKVTVSVN